MYDDQISYYASSLSFYTIFTLVPILYLILSIGANIPDFAQYFEQFKNFIFSNIMPVNSDAISKYLDSFMHNSIKLGFFSLIAIMIASMLFFKDFEFIVNKLFKTPSRNFFGSVAVFWMLLTLTPIALTLSFWLSSALFMRANELIHIGLWEQMILLFPYIIIWFLFFATFKIVPHTKVNTKAAFITSFIISGVWYIAKNGFVYYTFYAKTYATMYGSLAIFFFFFLWIYVSWLIVVYGFKLCYLLHTHYKLKDQQSS